MSHEVIVVGGGPAGLSAAILCAEAGASVLLADENPTPGGQLFKQIHKFFGSNGHYAGMRGTDIGKILVKEAEAAGVELLLNARVTGLLDDGSIAVHKINEGTSVLCRGRKTILAVGARENAVNFPGWTLPGVMTAGAAQTFSNVHAVMPCRKAVMVGSGNIGLIAAYQLMQAGVGVEAVIDTLPHIKGYGVHASKLSRAGVPFLLRHTIVEASGDTRVRQAVIAEIDEAFCFIKGSEKFLEVDSVILAVGLTPRVELTRMFGCRTVYDPVLGGHSTVHNRNMETSVPGVYVCGDVTGVEEASTALEEGRLAGIAAAESLGLINEKTALVKKWEIWDRLDLLRSGAFGEARYAAKQAVLQSCF